jgi:DNA-directed RNA polymerase subunit RPC12/RpoP
MRLYGEHHIRCPRCERRVVSVLINSVILWCATPVEVTARPGSETPLIVCPGCRELVPVDREVMRVL